MPNKRRKLKIPIGDIWGRRRMPHFNLSSYPNSEMASGRRKGERCYLAAERKMV